MKRERRKNINLKSKVPIKENTAIIINKKKNTLLLVIIAFCIPVLLYLQTIRFGFTHFDDDNMITNNITFLSDFSNVPNAFRTDTFIVKESSFYRPLETLSYMVDIKLAGGNKPWMYHLSNILLLGFISICLFLLLKRLFIPPLLALLSTLIFCAHPLFVSTIAFIPNRCELQLILFSLLSFLFFIEFLQTRKFIYMFLNWAMFTIALFCKETAALLPLLFIIYYITFSTDKRFEKKHIYCLLLYVISGILWFWFRTKAIGGMVSNPNDAIGIKTFLDNLRTIPEALTKFFITMGSSPFPAFSLFKTLTGFGIIILLIVLFFTSKERSKKEKFFCFSWFFFLMLPPMFYKHPFIDYYDHRFFFPLIGILIFLLFIFPLKWLKNGSIKTYWLFIAVWVLISSFTFMKSQPYYDPMSFYNFAILQNSKSAVAYCGRGNIKSDRGDFKGALADYNKAISIDASFYKAYYNRGSIKLDNIGDYPGALADFNIAISSDNKNANAYYNRGVANYNLGNLKEAIEDYNSTISIDPSFYRAYYNRGFLKNRGGNYQEAIKDFDKAIALHPDYAEAYNNRGVSLFSIHNFNEAINDFSKAIEINSSIPDAYYNRAFTRYSLKEFKYAKVDCENALKLNPNDERALKLKAKVEQELLK